MVRRYGRWLAVFVFTLAYSVSSAWAAGAADVPRMTVDELKAMLGKADLVVVDVRSEADWKASKLKVRGAVREDPAKAASWVLRYPKDKTYVLYCA